MSYDKRQPHDIEMGHPYSTGLSADAHSSSASSPHYFESSLLPQHNVLLRQNVAPIKASEARVKKTADGITSFDDRLQADPDELYRFFLTHLVEGPGLVIYFRGTHQGNKSIYLSHYVNPDWHAEALEEFTRSKNVLKELHLEKEIPWDYRNLHDAFVSAIRSTGYRFRIQVEFQRPFSSITVFSSSPIARAAQSWFTWVFLWISCLWVIFLPLFYMTRKKFKGRLAAHFNVNVGAAAFFQNNVGTVLECVHRRVILQVIKAK
ncbi:hypothetical protein BC829DRAFT_388038 [Chytridium lagenaria]|nr:hypothetical protein BC829DRAFT_388038 [Chytridium lagenaria]